MEDTVVIMTTTAAAAPPDDTERASVELRRPEKTTTAEMRATAVAKKAMGGVNLAAMNGEILQDTNGGLIVEEGTKAGENPRIAIPPQSVGIEYRHDERRTNCQKKKGRKKEKKEGMFSDLYCYFSLAIGNKNLRGEMEKKKNSTLKCL